MNYLKCNNNLGIENKFKSLFGNNKRTALLLKAGKIRRKQKDRKIALSPSCNINIKGDLLCFFKLVRMGLWSKQNIFITSFPQNIS